MRNVLLILSLTLGAAITAAQPDTDSIVAMFNKTKEKSKTKHGVTYSLFVDVKSVADVKRNPADYSGSYASDFGFTLDLTVAHDGS
ncbi:MAG: hypothetical protein M3Q69_08440, partial [Acidobacteriota bacterium]|nr:hypothetical protein [Acidobacteriota bacterium]